MSALYEVLSHFAAQHSNFLQKLNSSHRICNANVTITTMIISRKRHRITLTLPMHSSSSSSNPSKATTICLLSAVGGAASCAAEISSSEGAGDDVSLKRRIDSLFLCNTRSPFYRIHSPIAPFSMPFSSGVLRSYFCVLRNLRTIDRVSKGNINIYLSTLKKCKEFTSEMQRRLLTRVRKKFEIRVRDARERVKWRDEYFEFCCLTSTFSAGMPSRCCPLPVCSPSHDAIGRPSPGRAHAIRLQMTDCY